jgi:hypothetical protein
VKAADAMRLVEPGALTDEELALEVWALPRGEVTASSGRVWVSGDEELAGDGWWARLWIDRVLAVSCLFYGDALVEVARVRPEDGDRGRAKRRAKNREAARRTREAQAAFDAHASQGLPVLYRQGQEGGAMRIADVADLALEQWSWRSSNHPWLSARGACKRAGFDHAALGGDGIKWLAPCSEPEARARTLRGLPARVRRLPASDRAVAGAP